MTEKLYDLDSYLTRCRSRVLRCQPCRKNGLEGWGVVLEATCFFPEGGGQPSDTGSLGEARVLYVFEQDGEVVHLCHRPLPEGETVAGEVDFARRFSHMQTHTGEHILSGVILRELGLHNVGFHMGSGYNTIDLDGELSPAQALLAEQAANRVIAQNRPVHTSYPSPQALAALPLRKRPEVERLRLVEVEGCDLCGCCGTHVSRTGEIGLLKILDVQRYKGGARLTFLCGGEALEDYRAKHAMVREMAARLSCKPLELGDSLRRMEEETAALKAALASRERQLSRLLAQDLLRQAPSLRCNGVAFRWVFLASRELDAQQARSLALALSREEGVLCTAFALEDGGGVRYALSQGSGGKLPLGELCQTLNRQFHGKGGGKDLCCGSLEGGSPRQLEAAVAGLFPQQ